MSEVKQNSSQQHPGSPTRTVKDCLVRTSGVLSENKPSSDSPESPNLLHPFMENEPSDLENQQSLSPNLVNPDEKTDISGLVSSSSQTDMNVTTKQTQTDPVLNTKSVSDISGIKVLDHSRSRADEAVMADKECGLSSEPEAALLDKKQAADAAAGTKRNLWKKSFSFRLSEDYDSFIGDNLRSDAAPPNSENYFIDGVSLHVK